MPNTRTGTTCGFAWSHARNAGAVAVHISHRPAVVAGSGRSFGGNSRGFSREDETARARRVADHALGIERPGNPAVIGVGSAGLAWDGLSLHAAGELAAALER